MHLVTFAIVDRISIVVLIRTQFVKVLHQMPTNFANVHHLTVLIIQTKNVVSKEVDINLKIIFSFRTESMQWSIITINHTNTI